MKKYKLLKELPWLEAGTIIEYKDWEIYPKDNDYNKNIEKYLINAIENNDYYWWLEEIKEPKNIYNLKKWDTYFYIDDLWYIQSIVLDCIQYYKLRLEVWNVFLTYKEVLKAYYERKALTTIRKWIWENKINILDLWVSWYKIFTNWSKLLHINIYDTDVIWLGDINFKNQKDAEKCLKECKKEWKILFDLQNKNE